MSNRLFQIQLSEGIHRCSVYRQRSLVPANPAHCLHQLAVAKHDHLLMLGIGSKTAQCPLSAGN